MKYVLILSLFYKHYKKSSTLKIVLDDRFVDEIVLDKHIEHIDNVEELHAETIDNIAKDINKSKDWVSRKLNKMYPGPLKPQIQLPNKIWLYHLDINKNNKKLSLNFDVHDNNYSNGFMTKVAEVTLHRVGLIPEQFLHDDTLLKRLCTELREKTKKKFGKDYENIPEVEPYARPDYPFITQYEDFPIGGSTCIDIPIVKKHRMFMLRCDEPPANEAHPRFGQILVDPYFFWLKRQPALINTYKHEDKRSNHT